MKTLAIIPARGGSKGLPGKNIRSICDQPLISWTIKQALAAKSVDRVIVSTDNEEIANISRQYGADVPFMRPEELAGDSVSTEDALIHAVNWLQEEEEYFVDNVLLLQCTSPLRCNESIDAAISQFTKTQADSLLSVCPFWHFLWQDTNPPKALYDFKNRPMRQQIPSHDIKYRENGSLYLCKTSGLIKHRNRLFGQIDLFCMAEQESHEIDTEFDFVVVEAIMREYLSRGLMFNHA